MAGAHEGKPSNNASMQGITSGSETEQHSPRYRSNASLQGNNSSRSETEQQAPSGKGSMQGNAWRQIQHWTHGSQLSTAKKLNGAQSKKSVTSIPRPRHAKTSFSAKYSEPRAVSPSRQQALDLQAGSPTKVFKFFLHIYDTGRADNTQKIYIYIYILFWVFSGNVFKLCVRVCRGKYMSLQSH